LKTAFVLVAASFLAGCASLRPMPVKFTDPLSGPEHLQLATTYEAQGELAAAQREYRAAAKADKKNLAAQIGVGNTAFAQGQAKEAELAFLRALRISRDNPAASNNLAMLYASQGRKLATAEKLAKRAADDSRFRPYALDTLATIYFQQGRVDEARAAVTEARAAAPVDDPNFLPSLEKTAQAVGEAPNPVLTE